eukprot:1149493-Pelagomonas_calceolata.AAC.1
MVRSVITGGSGYVGLRSVCWPHDSSRAVRRWSLWMWCVAHLRHAKSCFRADACNMEGVYDHLDACARSHEIRDAKAPVAALEKC